MFKSHSLCWHKESIDKEKGNELLCWPQTSLGGLWRAGNYVVRIYSKRPLFSKNSTT